MFYVFQTLTATETLCNGLTVRKTERKLVSAHKTHSAAYTACVEEGMSFVTINTARPEELEQIEKLNAAKTKRREYARGRAEAMKSVGMKRTPYGYE